MKGDDILPHIPHALKYASAAEGELDPHVFFEVSVDDDDDGVSRAYFFLILTSTCCSPFLTISVCLTRVIVSQKLIGIQPMNWAMRIENVRSWISDSCFASPGPLVFGPNALCVQQEQKRTVSQIFEVQR